MKTTALEPKLIVPTSTLPPGAYRGEWGGYRVRFQADGNWYEVRTIDGIRTLSAPCIVNVTEDGITVATLG